MDGTSSESDPLDRKVCPLSRFHCRHAQFNESSLEDHYISEGHQKSLVKCVQQRIDSETDELSEDNVNTNQTNHLLAEYDEKLSVATETIKTVFDESNRLDSEIFQLREQERTLIGDLANTKAIHSMQRAYIDAMSINQQVLTVDTESVRRKIEDGRTRTKQCPDGTMLWRLTGVQEKIRDAQSERQTSVYSPVGYTSMSGYKFCVRIYLNGDGSARGTHISIFLVILRGRYDAIVKWPFSYRVSFCLYDQRTLMRKDRTVQPKHVIDSFRPDINSTSYQRPCSTMNIASGIPKFLSLDEFNRPADENLYILDDTIYIQTFIDFIGLPRTLVPFIFNLHVALPTHVKQELIAQEAKRRQEQQSV